MEISKVKIKYTTGEEESLVSSKVENFEAIVSWADKFKNEEQLEDMTVIFNGKDKTLKLSKKDIRSIEKIEKKNHEPISLWN